MVHRFPRTDPYKMSIFERSVTCSFFYRNCIHILTRIQKKKFEDMFIVKIAEIGKGRFWRSYDHFLSFPDLGHRSICNLVIMNGFTTCKVESEFVHIMYHKC